MFVRSYHLFILSATEYSIVLIHHNQFLYFIVGGFGLFSVWGSYEEHFYERSINIFFSEHMCALWGKYLRVELMGHRVSYIQLLIDLNLNSPFQFWV